MTSREKCLFISPAFVAVAFLFARFIQTTFLDYRPQKLTGHSAGVTVVEFSPDGRILASGSYDGNVLLWNTKSKEKAQVLVYGKTVVSLGFSPDGKELVSADVNGRVALWNLARGTVTKSWKAHNDWPLKARISPDNRMLVTTCADFGVRVWDKKSGRLIKELNKSIGDKHKEWVPFEFSPSGSYLATAIGIDGIIQIWDTKSFQCIKKIQVPFTTALGAVRYFRPVCLCFSPDEKSLAVSHSDINILDLKTGKQTFPTIHEHGLFLRYSPEGKRLIYNNDTETRVFDLMTGKTIQSFPAEIFGAVNGMALSPDGQQAAVALFQQNEVLLQKVANYY